MVGGRRRPFAVVPWLFAAVVAGSALIAPSAVAEAPQFVCGANEYENVDRARVPRPEAAPLGT
ncbi:hypothetical protein [Nocardia sp. BMG51109]|uniref:hypothetical protein n=1 Tax=Nocardia sp. BMG51109 TaxID=1056816 RepID=UPI000465DAA3|nr:hypothetical protein [Nocardia sp. BMG51109]